MSAEVPNFQAKQLKVPKPSGLMARINGILLNTASAVLKPIDARIAEADADWRHRAHVLAQDGLVRELAGEANDRALLPQKIEGEIIFPSPYLETQRGRILNSLVDRCRAIMTEPDPERIAPVFPPPGIRKAQDK